MAEPEHEAAKKSAETGGDLVRQDPAEKLLPALRSFVDLVEEEDQLGLWARYLRAIRRRRISIAFLVLAGLAVMAVEAFTATPLYRSVAVLQVDPEQPQVEGTGGSEAKPLTAPGERYLETLAQNARSRSIAGAVVEALDLNDDPRFSRTVRRGLIHEQATRALEAIDARLRPSLEKDAEERLRHDLVAEVVPGTRLLEIAYSAPDPTLAAEIANAVADESVEAHLASSFEASRLATAYLRERVDEAAATLEQAERQLVEALEGSEGAVAQSQLGQRRAQLADLQSELAAAEREEATVAAQFESVKDISAEELPPSLAGEPVERMAVELAALRTRLAGFSEHYGPEWPAVKEARSEIRRLESELETAQQAAIDRLAQRYRAARERRAQLEKSVASSGDRLQDQERSAVEVGALRREVDVRRQEHGSLLERLRETSSAAGLKASNLRQVDSAVTPARATRPRRWLMAVSGGGVGLLLGLLIAAVGTARDAVVRSTDDFRKLLRAPVLASVPRIGLGATRGWWARRRTQSGEPEIALDDEGMESFRELRSVLQLASPERPPATIMVTAATEADGASTVAVNTAIALAEEGARTALLDLDLRNPALGELLGFADSQGFTGFLSGNSDLASEIFETRFDNLFVVPAGAVPPDPAVLLASERMLLGFELLREYFTHIVIDTPPVLEYADALLTSARVEGVVLVVQDGVTSRRAAQRARNLFTRVGARLFGVVVNQSAQPTRPSEE